MRFPSTRFRPALLLIAMLAALVASASASAVNVPLIQGSSYVTAKIVAPTFTVKASGLTVGTKYQLSCRWTEGEFGGGPNTDFGPLVDKANASGVVAFAFSQPTFLPNPPGILQCNVQYLGYPWNPFTGPGNGWVIFPDGSNGGFWLKLYSTSGP